METKNSTGSTDIVGGSSVFGTGSGVLLGTLGHGSAQAGSGHARAPRAGAGHVGAEAMRRRPVHPAADTRSFRRFAGATLPSRGSTRPEVVGLT